MTSKDDEDAVRLMTAHGAKGLEFAHVFILRATSPSFPASYRETLVEFPGELRDPDSAAGGDDKTSERSGRTPAFLRGHDPSQGFAAHLWKAGNRTRRQNARRDTCAN